MLYGLVFGGCLILLTAAPWFRPRYQQLFFLPNPVFSIALLALILWPLAILHELAHWAGARRQGLPARITISRRYFVMVLQTDLTALWALPRRQRFGPLLAGLAVDTMATGGLLAARAAQYEGWWHPAPVLARLLAALVLAQVLDISFQFCVFLRTDLYAVLVTGLGCLNLTRVSRLRVTRRYRRLSATEQEDLAAASPRDVPGRHSARDLPARPPPPVSPSRQRLHPIAVPCWYEHTDRCAAARRHGAVCRPSR